MQRLVTGFYADAARETNRLMIEGWEIVPGTIGVQSIEDEEHSQPKGPRAKALTHKVYRQVMWAVLDDGYELVEDIEEAGDLVVESDMLGPIGQSGVGQDRLPGMGR